MSKAIRDAGGVGNAITRSRDATGLISRKSLDLPPSPIPRDVETLAFPTHSSRIQPDTARRPWRGIAGIPIDVRAVTRSGC